MGWFYRKYIFRYLFVGTFGALKSALARAFAKETVTSEIVEKATTGPAVLEEWKKGRKRHRLGGPAFSLTDIKTGTVVYESWEQNGRMSRDDGPALIYRDAITGFETGSAWYRDGLEITKPTPPGPGLRP